MTTVHIITTEKLNELKNKSYKAGQRVSIDKINILSQEVIFWKEAHDQLLKKFAKQIEMSPTTVIIQGKP